MNYYVQSSTDNEPYGISVSGTADWNSSIVSFSGSSSNEKGKVHAVLAFKYIKSKFGILEKMSLDRRLKKLEDAVYKALENGQDFLANKMLKAIAKETRESVLYAKGIKYFVEREDVWKYKNKIKGGHISDTLLKNYTRVIPPNVLKEKKKTDGLFDEYVIFHYYEKAVEEKLEKKQQMTADEKAKMKDPILFGVIKETDRLYFIADWEDEYCDLTFDEIVDVIGENKLTKYPEAL